MQPAKPRATVRGCVLTLLFVAALGYGLFAGLGFAWWGRGFAGAMAARHAPERVRAASTIYVYDSVIVVEPQQVLFRDSLWKPARRAILAALLTGMVMLLVRRRAAGIVAAVVIGALAFALTYARRHEVRVPRGAAARVEVRPYERGGGQSGTRHTTAWEKGWEVVLADGTRLVRLPWNEEADARIWRDLIAGKLGGPAPRRP